MYLPEDARPVATGAFAPPPVGEVNNEAGNAFDLLGLFGRPLLLLIQETITKVTGLTMVALDAAGNPVTELSSSAAPLCRGVNRGKGSARRRCNASDSYGAAEALAQRGVFIYFCPCGLLEAAIPIIARDRYLGSLLGGQVRCDNAPASLPRLEKLFEEERGQCLLEQRNRELYERIPSYDFAYFTYVAGLIFSAVTMIGERNAEALARGLEAEETRVSLSARAEWLERELRLKESELSHWKSRLNLDFFINSLNSIAGLAIIEGAPRTHEMCLLFAEHLRHSLASDKTFAPLADEVGSVQRYLQMQKIRFGDLLEYSVDMPKELAARNIPAQILLPFVERAVFHGLATKERGYRFSLSIRCGRDHWLFRIIDNAEHPGDVSHGAVPVQSGFDGEAIENSLAAAKRRLAALFGGRHELLTLRTADGGTEYDIRCPLLLAEGTGK